MAMLADLNRLATRKLSEARARAGIHIDEWEAMITLVRQTSEMAETKITLPEQFVSGIAATRDELKSADYLSSLKLDQLAIKNQQEVQTFALQRLKAVENQNIDTAASIKRNIADATALRDRKMGAANEEKSKRLQEANSARSISFDKSTFEVASSSSRTGCFGGIVLAVAIFVFAGTHANGHSTIPPIPSLIMMVFGVFGWVTLPIIVFLVATFSRTNRKQLANTKADTMTNEAEVYWRKATTKIEEEFNHTVNPLQDTLKATEIFGQRLMKAIAVLGHG